QCCGATSFSKGYLASIGPYPIRFLILSHQSEVPQVDYLPAPIQCTNEIVKSKETQPALINISSEPYGPQLPQTNSTAQSDSTITTQPNQDESSTPQSIATNTQTNLYSNTNINAAISPQIFVNYFKNQANIATNKSAIIVVPTFTPPPPPQTPSSSATYIVK
ncbi:MAG: hypothetical protein ACP5K7_13915, partial [Verrucomicrobiia bacterium]